MQLVLDKSKQKGSALLLEVIIANFAHDDGKGAWPSVETLAAYIRMTERNTQLLLRKIENSGEIRTVEGGGPYGTNAYEINVKLLERVKTFHPRRNQYARMKKRGRGVKSRAAGVKKSANIRVKATSPKPNRHQNRHRTVIEPSSSRKPNGVAAHLAELMMMHFGIEPTVAMDLAQQEHVTEEYLQKWIAYSQRDVQLKLTANDDEKVLGAGFYYDRIKRGLSPDGMTAARRKRAAGAKRAPEPNSDYGDQAADYEFGDAAR